MGHASESDCWVIVGEDVYDVTNFMAEHPGGKKAIMLFAGKDATEEFDMLHERKVIKKYGLDQGTVTHKGKLSKWTDVRKRKMAVCSKLGHGQYQEREDVLCQHFRTILPF